jgi:hypothetical protein
MRGLLSLSTLIMPLLLGGCVVGDSVAHVVKVVGKATASNGDDPAASSAAPQASPAAPADREPPPQPKPAPRDEIKVESLPAPGR